MSDNNGTQLTPLALTILGFTPVSPPPAPADAGASSQGQPRQYERRVVSYSNTLQTRCIPSTDAAPSYAVAAKQARIPRSFRYLDNGNEVLPKYTCSVSREGPMYMLLESCNPFLAIPEQEWREVYVVLEGTQLNIHKVKNTHLGKESIQVAGKLLRKYTLQQAEVGLAPDGTHNVLVPATRLAHLLPAMARRRAFEKDPNMFRIEKRYSLRLRVEADQILLATQAEEAVFAWVNKICAGIDIAPAIDDRTIPRQCTVPRRRRRQRQQIAIAADLSDRRLIEEQERILQQMYPAFAQESRDNANTQDLSTLPTIPIPSPALVPTTSNDQEQEDVDISALAEEVPASTGSRASRPSAVRLTTSSSQISTATAHDNLMSDPLNFSAEGKWAPLHVRSNGQQLRYTRRCMPLIFIDSPRASSIMIHNGKYVRPNYKMDLFDEWELQPPCYDAHDFPEEEEDEDLEEMPVLTRTPTNASSVSAGTSSPATSSNEITPASSPILDVEVSTGSPLLTQEKSRSGKPIEIRNGERRPPQQIQTKAGATDGIESGVLMFGF